VTRYYHTTDAADAILRDGFRDGEGTYGFATYTLSGVFLADDPVDINEGAVGDQVLAIDLAVPIDDYELVADGNTSREWCVPAELINSQGIVTLLTEDEVDELAQRRFNRWVRLLDEGEPQ